jgi:N6-adenosine-specific RNA methylase IME4
MLSELAPGSGGAPARAKSAGRTLLDRLNLPKQRASELSRIAAMPDEARTKALKAIYRESRLAYTKELVEIARPYWSREQREARHCAIKRKAEAQRMSDQLGPFPLLYCDPPWTFETWHPSGQENARMPNQHYPVLTDAQLCSLHVNGTPIQDIAAKDACLFLWCTSSNIERALGVMRAWGFTFKTNAVWDKALNGTGYIFLNQHEHVLYGTRGSMPAPLPPLPSSVIRSPRGRHSEKPREVRSMIEQMFPQFDSKSRIELFARGQIPGWTTWGFEA